MDARSTCWACVHIVQCGPNETVFNTELLPTDATMVNVSSSNRRCYNTFAERTGVYVLRGSCVFPTACLQEAGRRHVSRAHFHGICRMIMCACFLVFGDCFLVLIAFSNLVFRSLSPNAHRCVVGFRASFMSTVSSRSQHLILQLI